MQKGAQELFVLGAGGQAGYGYSLEGRKNIMRRREGIFNIDPKTISFSNNPGEGFVNPRHFHQQNGEGTKPQGLDDDSLRPLFEDIVERGVTKPLIVRASGGSWNKEGNQLVDGERRLVCSLRGNLEGVPCYVYDDMSDEEAWMVAWRENDTGKAIGENATAALVKHWRDQGWGDDKILALTKRTPQWLRQMDILGALDAKCFEAYTTGHLSLRIALKLAQVDDVDLRHELLEETLSDANADQKDWIAKQKKIISRLEDRIESSEARVAAAEIMGSDDEKREAEAELAKHQEALQQATTALNQEKNIVPMAKNKNLARASKKVGAKQVASAVSRSKLKRALKQIDAFIENDGMDGDAYVAEVDHLQIVRCILSGILEGNDNFKEILAEYYNGANGEVAEEKDEADDDDNEDEDYEEGEEEDEDYEEEDVDNEEIYDEIRKHAGRDD